jgi:hypothetical protein
MDFQNVPYVVIAVSTKAWEEFFLNSDNKDYSNLVQLREKIIWVIIVQNMTILKPNSQFHYYSTALRGAETYLPAINTELSWIQTICQVSLFLK